MNETFKIKEINFDFRNKYKYAEETESLKRVLPILIPFLENYLSKRSQINEMKEKLRTSENWVHFAITDPKREDLNTHFGSVAYDSGRKQIIIVLRIVLDNNNCPLMFELMKTMVHEIFHLFIEGEKEVRENVEEFLNSFNFKERKKILGILIGEEKVNNLLKDTAK